MISKEERKEIAALWNKLKKYRYANAIKQSYYEGKRRVKDLGVSIPPGLKNVQESVGWPKIAVDSLNERIQLEGWANERLNQIFDENYLDDLAHLAHLDALRYGIGFIIVGAGDPEIGEPEILVTVESPNSVAANYSLRLRRTVSAIKIVNLPDGKFYGNFFTDTEVIPFFIDGDTILEVEDEERTEHNLGRLPVVQILNRPDTDTYTGHSEITENVISLTNSMMRTLLGMEVAREFYAAPQRWILGGEQEMFIGPDGSTKSSLDVLMDRMLVLPPLASSTGAASLPQVGQFDSNSPEAFLEPMRFYAQLFAAEACVPENYLGFNTVNPTSADAIRASESRLIKKAEKRIASFRRAWIEVANLIKLMIEEEIEDFNPIPIFANPATPTRAAAADEVTKLISQGVLSADSDIALRRLGFDRLEREQIKADANARNATLLARTLAAAAPEVTAESVV